MGSRLVRVGALIDELTHSRIVILQNLTMAEASLTPPNPASDVDLWHVAQDDAGQCKIVTQTELSRLTDDQKRISWGPFSDQSTAIARRVGLIRAGKCKPV